MISQVAIIGGGFSGLTLAYYLERLGVDVEVFEKTDRLGGLISTSKFDWGYVETAANGLMGSPLVDELFRDLHLQYAERPTHATRARYIFREQPRRWPLSTKENVQFIKGLAGIFGRQYIPRAFSDNGGDSKGLTSKEWISRKLGESAFDYLVGPALQGIMGTDDIAADLLIDYVRGAMISRRNVEPKKSNSPVRRGTVSPKQGMGELISSLATRIEELGGLIHLNSSDELRKNSVTVLAVPAYTAAAIVRDQAPELSQQLMGISYLPLTTVTASFARHNEREKIQNGFGCLFPTSENFAALGVLFSSSIFARLYPGSETCSTETWLLRDSEHASQETLIRKIVGDRSRLLGIASALPANVNVTHWPQALPHYNLKLNETLKLLPKTGESISGIDGTKIYLTGNYLGQIGLSRILSRNYSLARQIATELTK